MFNRLLFSKHLFIPKTCIFRINISNEKDNFNNVECVA